MNSFTDLYDIDDDKKVVETNKPKGSKFQTPVTQAEGILSRDSRQKLLSKLYQPPTGRIKGLFG